MRKPALVLLVAACGSQPQFVAEEELGVSELRVVVARTEHSAEVVALAIDRPYRFELEPLDDVFARGDRLEIAIFGFDRARLTAAIPGLRERSVAEIVAALSPELGAEQAGRYAPPEPERILSAIVERDSTERIAYGALDWESARTRPELAFGFRLPSELACPPAGVPMRIFNRRDPSVACVVLRNPACEWITSGCDLSAIFGDAPLNGAVRESPDRALVLPDGQCPALAIERGETRAWRCGAEIVAAQEQVTSAEGTPWVPQDRVEFTSGDFALPHLIAPSVNGALLAFEDQGQIELRRLAVSGGTAALQNLETPLLDGVGRSARRATSSDGLAVTVEGELDARTGVGPLQCFQTLIGRRQDRSSSIDEVLAPDTVALVAPGLGVPIDTSAWQIVGDPGPDFIMTPDVVEIEPPPIGAPLRISSGGAQVAVQGTLGDLRLLRLQDRFPNDLNYFACALRIDRPADLIGELAAGRDRFYGIASDGVRVLDSGGAPLGTLGASRALTGAERLAVVEADDGGEVVVVWSLDSRRIEVIGAGGSPDRTATVAGDPVAILPGPRAVVAMGPAELTLVDLLSDASARVPLPAFSPSAAVELLPEAAIEVGNRTVLGFATATHIGMIDAGAGLSSAVEAPNAHVTALFAGEGGALWAVVETGAAKIDLYRFPLLP